MRDPSKNFGETAKRYSALRPDYPPQTFEFLRTHLTGGRTQAVDLGAGSGQATRALAEHFDRVVAIEPDARLAGEGDWPENARVIHTPAEEAIIAPGTVDAIISATAFHWMDQRLICKKASLWLRPGGVLFPFAFDSFRVQGAAADFYQAENNKWAAFRDQRLDDCYDYSGTLVASREFESVIPYAQTVIHVLSAGAAAGLISTFSFACEYARTLDSSEDYFRGIKEEFEAAGETVTFVVPIIGALARKP